MNAFQKKTLSEKKRVCLRLRDARLAYGMSIAQMAKKTKIDKHYIDALENCDYDALPEAPIYRKNFIRSYLEALDINSTQYIRQYVIEENVSEHVSLCLPKKQIKQPRFNNLPSLIKYMVAIGIVLAIGGYLGLQVYHIIEPPQLTILNPSSNYITNKPNITIRGIASLETKILVNGQPVHNKNNGEFKQSLDLSPGVNTILVSAQNKHGKITKKTLHIVLQQSQSLSLRQ